MIRLKVSEISKMGRNTQGVTLMRLSEGTGVDVADIVGKEDDEEE